MSAASARSVRRPRSAFRVVGAGAVGLALLAPAAAGAQAVRVEGVAAIVGGTAPGSGATVVYRSDAVLRARIALAGRSERLPVGPVPEALLAAALDELIGEVLIEREADRLRAARPSDEEVARERRRIEAQAGGAARLSELLRAVGASDEEVDRAARRRAYVNAFLRANLEGSTVVSDAQLARVYESERHPFAGRPLEEVREPLRAWIARRALARDVRRWIEVLRRRTTVLILVPWQRASDGAADGAWEGQGDGENGG